MSKAKGFAVNALTVDGVRYVPESSVPPTRAKPSTKGDGGVRIVILQRGWVVVGHYFDDGERFRVENAAVVRVWGTTKGLGELAENGPISGKTTLDDCGVVRGHVGAIVATNKADIKAIFDKIGVDALLDLAPHFVAIAATASRPHA